MAAFGAGKPGQQAFAVGRVELPHAVRIMIGAGPNSYEVRKGLEIAANPRDTKDYPQGVWTLPPSLRSDGVVLISEGSRKIKGVRTNGGGDFGGGHDFGGVRDAVAFAPR